MMMRILVVMVMSIISGTSVSDGDDVDSNGDKVDIDDRNSDDVLG